MTPTPAEIRAARLTAGLSLQQAGEILGMASGNTNWPRYESGRTAMHPAIWAYWKHVAGIERIPFRSRMPAK